MALLSSLVAGEPVGHQVCGEIAQRKPHGASGAKNVVAMRGRSAATAAAAARVMFGGCSERWSSRERVAVRFGCGDEVLRRARCFRFRSLAGAVEGGQVSARAANRVGLYDKFLEHAVRTVRQRADLSPLPCQDEFGDMVAVDGQTVIKNVAFESTKFRLFRCATIDGGDNMQVLNVAICARPEYDLPIFCADFFSTASRNIVVLDLNPLYNIELRPEYRDKYFSHILPLGHKYAELLPWGDKLTAESLQFFSPIVIWTRPDSREDIQDTIFSAFRDYLAAWLEMAERARPSEEAKEIAENQESHHRYLMWRATKDPGRFVLMRLFGEALCERYINEFLFNGVTTLGTKEFLDYFPEYRGEDGGIVKQRSMVGKSYAERPWNKEGIFSPSL